jgi:hypothetical protein
MSTPKPKISKSAREQRLDRLKAVWNEILKVTPSQNPNGKGIPEKDLSALVQRVAGVKADTAKKSYIQTLFSCGCISYETVSIRSDKGVDYSEVRVVANPTVPPGETSVGEWETDKIKS